MDSINTNSPKVLDWAIGQVLSPSEAMKLAISVARMGAPFVSPNPQVGCVILDSENRLLSMGHHEKYGEFHAEVNALRNLSIESLKGAQVFVTLEPCAHEGKTPSCAKMLASLPIGKLIYGLIDPNPLVSGKGLEILRNAGIEIQCIQDLQQDLTEVCETFLWNQNHQKPFVSLKIATSLDGKFALKNGESRWITGPESREEVHYLRACYDAILVGSSTIERDNPSLTIRSSRVSKVGKIIVLDSTGRILRDWKKYRIFSDHDPSNLYFLVSAKANEKGFLGVPVASNVLYIPEREGLIDLSLGLQKIYEKRIFSIFIEGGGRVSSSFLNAQIVNRLYLFMAPILLGGIETRGWTDELNRHETNIGLNEMKMQLRDVRYSFLGKDLMATGLF